MEQHTKVLDKHVQKAIRKIKRSNLYEEMIEEQFEEQILMMDTTGFLYRSSQWVSDYGCRRLYFC